MTRMRAPDRGADAQNAGRPPTTSHVANHGNDGSLANGGNLEKSRRVDAHESRRMRKSYSRTGDEIKLDEVEGTEILWGNRSDIDSAWLHPAIIRMYRRDSRGGYV